MTKPKSGSSERAKKLAKVIRSKSATKSKLGSGVRFKKLTNELRAKGAYNPEALAAWIGRRKYGSKRFQQLSVQGKKNKSKKK